MRFLFRPWRVLAVIVFSAAGVMPAAEIARYARFEASFTSAKDYPNPFQDVRVQVEFAGPGDARQAIDAFWDGERTWRVRFSPETEGEWTFETRSSDTANAGLHAQRGAFQCVRNRDGKNPLYQHGPLRVSAARTHLEHADGTPFFWLADTAWAGALLSTPDDWARFLADRKAKRFNVVQFMGTQNVTAAADAQGRQAYTEQAKIVLDPYFFRRLDQRFDAVNDAGLIAAPTFAWAAQYMPAAKQLDPGAWLPDDQLIAFGRYFVARYGAHQVVWLFAGDYDYRPPAVAERWRKLGRAIFGDQPTRLVTVHPAPKMVLKTEFGREPWLAFLGYQSSHSNDDPRIEWIVKSGPAREWSLDPMRPIINLEPIYEAHMNGTSKRLATVLEVRQACWWSVLATPVAGVSYGAHGVWSWETQPAIPMNHLRTGVARPWHEAIKLPGSTHLKHLRAILETVAWPRLRPMPALLTAQPGEANIQHWISAAQTDDARSAVIYLPGGVADVTVDLAKFPAPVKARWIDPTTGRGKSIAGAPFANDAARAFAPPGTNAGGDSDWVLVLEAAAR